MRLIRLPMARQKTTFLPVSLVALLLLACSQVWAHAKQENYIWLNVEEDAIAGRFELNINDVRGKLDLDVDELGDTRLEGLTAARETLEAFLQDNFRLSDEEGEIPYQFGSPSLFSEGNDYLQFPYKTDRLPVGSKITIENTIWLVPPYSEADRFHRSMIVAQYNQVTDQAFGDSNVAIVFSPDRLVQTLDLENPGQILTWPDFLWQGVLHIGIGLDHILFIVVLLLGVVMQYENKQWQAVERASTAIWKTVRIVTIFTIAHSITLSLAALNLVNVPGALVETIIAVSIIAMALNNIFPLFSGHSWILVFAFGLFHGLGFASVMGDLQFRVGLIERILIMFNVGVELGQLALVVMLLPILLLLRHSAIYRPVVMTGISMVAIVIALWWVGERTGLIAQ